MRGKKIFFYILGAFISGTLLLIYIQYNSTKNISSLIKGNEKLLNEFNVNSELKELKGDITSVENKVRGVVLTKDTSHIEELEAKIAEVENDLDHLQKITDDDSTVKFIDDLDRMVHQKIFFSKKILDSSYSAGRISPQNLITNQESNRLTDSIELLTEKIEITRQNLLTGVTSFIDKSGKKAEQFSTVLIVLVLVSGAGLFWYIINTIRKQISLIQQLNISEKKVRESARLKENFIANMSHEIRTPMTAILGFTNLLQYKNLDEESKLYLQTIQKSGESLLNIINDVLDLSKIEAGMVRIESAPFSIRELLHSIEIMLKPKAAEKQLQLSIDVDESVPDILEGDPSRLTQILLNLVGNALKFTSQGRVSVSITNEGISDNILNTGITVADTGIGVEKEKLQHIFERFQQAEDSITRKYGGTGLGLSIARDLVLLQNGTIGVESELGIGTTFKLMIPYKISTENFTNKPYIESRITHEINFENHCILVVEDNEINQSLLKQLFKSWHLNFDLANNGREAIDKLMLNKYDLILMDIQMPEMDGYTTAIEIREKLNLTIPIIAMTAHAFAGEREKCISCGMNEYISKPIREKLLQKLISHFIGINPNVILPSEPTSSTGNGTYHYINLQYMKEVSRGNTEYEKTVTEQFIEAMPRDLQSLEKAWKNNDIIHLREIAHNMKTTVSVMGLNELLEPYLDTLEFEDLNQNTFYKSYLTCKSVCETSLEEAKLFHSSF
jgi:signal transduction histidine kinase/CheY-like chemotaxis protein